MNAIVDMEEMDIDTGAVMEAVLQEKLADAQVPGFWTEFAPDEADLAGAFVEQALAETDATVSHLDLISPDNNDAKESS
ncbi:MAG: hypothetical protein K2X55_29400 [Burkholderiaceae bacterium]|nr:hypothetical protein [Burkholderiaceae bacterium]